jgi:hypothetical protein
VSTRNKKFSRPITPRPIGIIPRLGPNFKTEDTLSAYLCSPFTDHLSTGFMDLGWGCGYRNCQMLMTFLERQNEDGEPLLKNVLDIPGIQLLIEKAWNEGIYIYIYIQKPGFILLCY